MNEPELNFLEAISRDQYKVFRKRVLGLILATDMAQHASSANFFKGLLEEYGIQNGQNVEKLVEMDDEAVV